MWQYNHTDELCHYGVLGMKWGVRRYQDIKGSVTKFAKSRRDNETAYREKLSNISNNTNVNKSDLKRIKYRNQSLLMRAAQETSRHMMYSLVLNTFSGKFKRMSKDEIKKELIQSSLRAVKKGTSDVIKKDALAKSASKKYADDGSRIKGNQKGPTREDVMEVAANITITAAPMLTKMAATKYSTAKAERAKNEAKFRSWGGNILESNYDNFVWISSDKWKVQ